MLCNMSCSALCQDCPLVCLSRFDCSSPIGNQLVFLFYFFIFYLRALQYHSMQNKALLVSKTIQTENQTVCYSDGPRSIISKILRLGCEFYSQDLDLFL